MLRILILSVLLSLKPGCGLPNERAILTYIYEDEPIKQMQHQMQLQSVAIENLRLRLELISEVLNDIRGKLSAGDFSEVTTKKNQIGAQPTSCLGLAGGLQVIQLNSTSPFIVSCDNETQGGGWAVIQRRRDGSIDFNQNWAAYKQGFGDLDGEFFIGLDKLHELTTSYTNELLIIMRDKRNVSRFANYETFAIADEDEYYALKTLGKYSGNAGDALTYHHSQRFSTKDNCTANKCTVFGSSGWWYDSSRMSQLNGKYGNDIYGQGINWGTFRDYSLPFVEMKIRPKSP